MIGQRNAPNAELNVDGHTWIIFMIQLAKGKNAMTQPVTSSGLLEAPKWSISTDRQGLAPGGCGAGGGEVFGTEECNQESILLVFLPPLMQNLMLYLRTLLWVVGSIHCREVWRSGVTGQGRKSTHLWTAIGRDCPQPG